MADVFVSYASVDRDSVTGLVSALERVGLSVFWDRHVQPGKDWSLRLEHELATARCVVVVWSHAAVASRWVKEEALVARERGVLLPVLVGDVVPPVGFRGIQGFALPFLGTNEAPFLAFATATDAFVRDGGHGDEHGPWQQPSQPPTDNLLFTSSKVPPNTGLVNLVGMCFRTAYEIVFRTRSFTLSFDFAAANVLRRAMLFAVFVSVLNALLISPWLRAAEPSSMISWLSFLVFDTVATTSLWCLQGLLLFLVAKGLGGRGRLDATIALYFYLKAFTPLIGVLQLPVFAATDSAIYLDNETATWDVVLHHTHELWSKPLTRVCGVLYFYVMVLQLRAMYLAVKKVHDFAARRAVAFVGLGFVALAAAEVFVRPMFALFYGLYP